MQNDILMQNFACIDNWK